MTEGPALLRAVIANPADDTPRLVYADWLDENGEPDRAEFVRTQVRLAGMEPWDDGYTALDVRCRQLERAHPEWFDVPADFLFRMERFCGQRERSTGRGFLARVKMPPGEFAKHTALFDRHPITDVQFKIGERTGAGWLKRAALKRLTAAEFGYGGAYPRGQIIRLCLERLRPLDHFGMLGSRVDEADALAIFAHPTVTGVRSLWIGGTPLTEAAEAAFASAAWPNLRKLTRVWISDAEWLRAPWVSRLRELRVSDTEPNLDPARRRVLAEVLPGTEIHTLDLAWWELDAAGGRALGEAVAKSPVRSLALGQTRTRAEVARALLTPEALAGLRALYLSWAELDADVVGRLAGTGLRACALAQVNCDALSALAKQSGLPELTDLRLGFHWRTADDPFPARLRAVLESGALPRLTRLMLCDSTPRGASSTHGDATAVAVAGCPAASALRELQLCEAVTKVGAAALANSPHLGGLQLLDVRVWPKDPAAERLLVDRFGPRAYLETVSREF